MYRSIDFPFRSLLGWGCVALFYFYQFLLQVTPSVMMPEIQSFFDCNAQEFGSISAYFLYAYALMQLPVGLTLDKYGPRWILSVACFVCAIGSYLFATAEVYYIAKAARFLMGLGGAFAVVGCMKVASMQFSAKHFSLMTGMTIMIGMSGAALGQSWIGSLVHSASNWQSVFMSLSILGFILSAVIALFVSNQSEFQSAKNSVMQLTVFQELKLVLVNKRSWLAALYAGLMYTPTLALGELWGVPFLTEGHHISRQIAHNIVPCIFIGWAMGSPSFGFFAELCGRNTLMFIANVAVLGLVLLAMSPLALIFNGVLWSLIFGGIGFFSAGFILAFTSVKEANPEEIAATSSGFTNTINTICGALAQPIIGLVLDHQIRVHHRSQPLLEDYHVGLMVIVICLVAALFFLLSLISLEIHEGKPTE